MQGDPSLSTWAVRDSGELWRGVSKKAAVQVTSSKTTEMKTDSEIQKKSRNPIQSASLQRASNGLQKIPQSPRNKANKLPPRPRSGSMGQGRHSNQTPLSCPHASEQRSNPLPKDNKLDSGIESSRHGLSCHDNQVCQTRSKAKKEICDLKASTSHLKHLVSKCESLSQEWDTASNDEGWHDPCVDQEETGFLTTDSDDDFWDSNPPREDEMSALLQQMDRSATNSWTNAWKDAKDMNASISSIDLERRLNEETTFCTVNGERVMMQKNLVFQPSDLGSKLCEDGFSMCENENHLKNDVHLDESQIEDDSVLGRIALQDGGSRLKDCMESSNNQCQPICQNVVSPIAWNHEKRGSLLMDVSDNESTDANAYLNGHQNIYVENDTLRCTKASMQEDDKSCIKQNKTDLHYQMPMDQGKIHENDTRSSISSPDQRSGDTNIDKKEDMEAKCSGSWKSSHETKTSVMDWADVACQNGGMTSNVSNLEIEKPHVCQREPDSCLSPHSGPSASYELQASNDNNGQQHIEKVVCFVHESSKTNDSSKNRSEDMLIGCQNPPKEDTTDRTSLSADTMDRTSLSAEKICNILSFLKQVEEANLPGNCITSKKENLEKEASHRKNGCHFPQTIVENYDLISLAESNATTTSTLSNQHNVIDEEIRTLNANEHPSDCAFIGIRKNIQNLKDKIMKQKTRIVELESEKERIKKEKEKEILMEREKYSKEIHDQAAEYKEAIKQHLLINEKMIKDKETLSDKCCSLTTMLAMAESKFEERLKSAKEQWVQEMKKQKEAWNAGEKAKRESWMERKIKEIREMTIIGLEPHIESIHERHRQEVQKLEAEHRDEIFKRLELQSIQHHQEIRDLREQLLKERDDMLDKERLAAHARMNEMAEKYEQQAMEQRMRIASELTIQLERSEASRRDDKQYNQELLSRFQREANEREENVRKHHERAFEDLVSKNKAEIDALQSRWQDSLDQALETRLKDREKQIEAKCIAERNKEIELIMEKLLKERDEAIQESDWEKTKKIEELMKENSILLKKLKECEVYYMELCKEALEAKEVAQRALSTSNSQVDDFHRELEARDAFIEELKRQVEQGKIQLALQEEQFGHHIKDQQERLEMTIADLSTCQHEIEEQRIKKASELAKVEAKVKAAIEKRDMMILDLQTQLQHAHEQIQDTELLLEQEQNIIPKEIS